MINSEDSEKAKAELIHVGILGMKWGHRKGGSKGPKRKVGYYLSLKRADKFLDDKKKARLITLAKWSPLLVPAGVWAARNTYNLAYISLKVGMVKAVQSKHARQAAAEAAKKAPKLLRLGSGAARRVIDSKFVGG